MIVVATGAPGSGKTTLARRLGAHLRLPVVSRDDFRTGLFFSEGGWGPLPRRVPSVEESIEAFFDSVCHTTSLGVSCVIDYVLRSDRPQDLQRLSQCGRPVFVELSCAVANQRFAARTRLDPLLARPAVLAALGCSSIEDVIAPRIEGFAELSPLLVHADLPGPRIAVDTTDGYTPDLESVIEFIVAAATA